jgi:hypothetical protein
VCHLWRTLSSSVLTKQETQVGRGRWVNLMVLEQMLPRSPRLNNIQHTYFRWSLCVPVNADRSQIRLARLLPALPRPPPCNNSCRQPLVKSLTACWSHRLTLPVNNSGGN